VHANLVGMLFFTSSRDHIAPRAKSYKESSRFGKYILKEILSSGNFAEKARRLAFVIFAGKF
jgi:hypothetical protein